MHKVCIILVIAISIGVALSEEAIETTEQQELPTEETLLVGINVAELKHIYIGNSPDETVQPIESNDYAPIDTEVYHELSESIVAPIDTEVYHEISEQTLFSESSSTTGQEQISNTETEIPIPVVEEIAVQNL